MEPPPGGTGNRAPASSRTAGCCGQVAGGQRLGSPDQLQQLEACGESAGRDRTPRPRDPEGTLRVSPARLPPLPGRISWAFPSLPDGTPSRSLGRQREGGTRTPAAECRRPRETRVPRGHPPRPRFQGPGCRRSRPWWNVATAATPPEATQEDARQARGC